jgi:hypothetical protein
MARAKEFIRELDALLTRRTQWLRSVLSKPKPGTPKGFGRKHIDRGVRRMQSLASDSLARRLARSLFDSEFDFRRSWHPKKGKGWGRAEKQRRFKEWFRDQIGAGPTIYVFWAKRRCLYVGKTDGLGGRVASHFVKHWFGAATRIDVYAVYQRRSLSALECMAIHRFQPAYNRAKAESKKWTKKCPLCVVHRDIEAEVRGLLRLR